MKNTRKKLLKFVIATFTVMASIVVTTTMTASAQYQSTIPPDKLLISKNTVTVVLNGEPYIGEAMIIDSTTYVGFREFSERCGASSIKWNDSEKTASATFNDLLTVYCDYKNGNIIANSAKVDCSSPILIINSRMYVPIRAISSAIDKEVSWDAKTFTVNVNDKRNINTVGDDLYWLSRIINAEAGTEPMDGKIAVGNVVLNRVKCPDYPDNIRDVIFDTEYGVQFTPTANGTVYEEPSKESIAAAIRCLNGENNIGDALFFVNPELAENTWVQDNCNLIDSIGEHSFYN